MNGVEIGEDRPVYFDITIIIVGHNEHRPDIDGSNFEFSVKENEANQTIIGTISAMDDDSSDSPGGTLQYYLSLTPTVGTSEDSCTDNLPFYINSNGDLHTCDSLDYEYMTAYSFYVSVCDSGDPRMCVVSSENVNVTVIDLNDNPPILNADFVEIYLAENDTTNKVLHTITWTDADSAANSIVNLSFQSSDTAFNLSGTTIVIANEDEIDYEVLPNFYSLQVTATNPPSDPTDESQSAVLIINITITDVNDESPVISGRTRFNVTENKGIGTFIGAVTASDREEGDNGRLTFMSLDKHVADSVCGSGNEFALDEMNGTLTTCVEFDFEQQMNHYPFMISVCDNGSPSLCDVKSFEVNVTDLNDNKPVFATDPIQLLVEENTPADTSLYKIVTSDKDSDENSQVTYMFLNTTSPFEVHNGDEIYYNGGSLLDYEGTKNKFIIQLRATNAPSDPNDLTQIVDMVVLIDVTDCNDLPPVFDTQNLTEFVVDEHSAQGVIITNVSTTDADTLPNRNVSYQVTLGSNIFTMMGASLTVKDSVLLDREEIGDLTLTKILATNPSDECGDTQTSELTLSILIADINDNTPYFVGSLNFMINEDAHIGAMVGRVRTMDIDSGQNAVVQYFLESSEACSYGNKLCMSDNQEIEEEEGSGVGSGDNSCTEVLPFDIDPDSGVLETCIPLDFETFYSYTLKIKVCDRGKPSKCNSTDYFVVLTDVNDNTPVIKGPFDFSVNETATSGYVVGCVNATDEDTSLGGMVRYYTSGSDECTTEFPFQVNDTSGCIIVCNELNYEETMEYTFTLLASDLGEPQLNSTALIKINIMNRNDHGPQIIIPVNVSVIENAVDEFVVAIEATDEDHSPHNMLVFSLTDDAAGRFNITDDGEVYTQMALDREMAQYHLITVKVSDGIFSDMKVVNITVTDDNDQVPVYLGGSNFAVIENTFFTIDLDFVDYDVGENAEISLKSNDSRFYFNDSSPLTLKNNIYLDRDPETGGNPTVSFEVTATDHGSLELTGEPVTITLTIEDVNDNAPIPQPPFKGNIPDGTMNGSFVLELSAIDYDEGENSTVEFSLQDQSDTFIINETKLITNKDITLESNEPININVTVVVSDKGVPTLSTAYTVTVYIIDTLPYFTPDSYTFFAAENAFLVDVGQVFASDRDLERGNENFVYSIVSESPYGGFSLINSTVYSPSDYIDYEDNVKFTLVLGVGNGDMTFDQANVSICVNDTNEIPPFLSPVNLTVSLNENSPIGHVLGQVVAIDFELGENGEVSYNILSGEGLSFFSIDTDGNLTLENATAADFEQYENFKFTYNACDNGSPKLCSSPGYIFINVIDSDDVPPVFQPESQTIDIEELFAANVLIAHVTVSDIDTPNTELEFSLVPQYPQFSVQPVTGNVFTTDVPLDYETQTNFTFSIVATDRSGLTGSSLVTINVVDINDNRAKVESNVTVFQPLEGSSNPVSLSALNLVDEDAISKNMIDKIEVKLYRSTLSKEVFPLEGGFCDHANLSYINTRNGFDLCNFENSCDDWQQHLQAIGGSESNGTIYFEKSSHIARDLSGNKIQVAGSDLASDFTMSFWVTVDSPGRVVRFETASFFPLTLEVSEEGYFQAVGTTDSILAKSNISLLDDNIHQLMLIRKNLTLSLYVDGILGDSRDTAHEIDTSFSGNSIVIFGEDLVGSLSQTRYCPNFPLASSDVECITSCGEVFGAEGTENVTATVNYRSRSVEFKCKVDGSCSLNEMNQALDTLTFINLADEPNPVDRGLGMSANDTNGFGEESIFIIRPELVNDKLPVLDLNGDITDDLINYTLTYVEGAESTAIFPDEATLYDLDSGYWRFNKIVVSIVNPTTNEKIETVGNIPSAVSVEGSNSTLTFSSASSDELYPEVLVDALKTLHYLNEEEDPSNAERIIELTVHDYTDMHTNNPLSQINITITPANDIPELTIDITSVQFDEEDRQVVLLENAMIVINDPDDDKLNKATVELRDQVYPDDESLSVETTDLSAVYDTATSILTINGSASISKYVETLKKVVYKNTNVNPTNAEREILVRVTDASGGTTAAAQQVTITVKLYNDPPVFTFESTGNSTHYVSFVEDQDTCVFLFGEFTLEDPEGLSFQSLKVARTATPDSDEVIEQTTKDVYGFNFAPNERTYFFVNLDVNAVVNFTNTIQYCNDEEEPESSVVEFTITWNDEDGATSEGNIILSVQHVNDLPMLQIEPIQDLAFGDQQNQFIDQNSIEFSDKDDTEFNEIKIVITNPRDGVQNELIQAAGNIPSLGVLTGTDVGEDGSFTFNINFPNLADNTTIVNTIKELRYNNIAGLYTYDTPRTICISVNDTKDFSVPACVNITLSPPNLYSPIITNGLLIELTYDEDTSPQDIVQIDASDSDEDAVSSVVAYSLPMILSTASDGTIQDTTNAGIFSINSTTGKLTAPNGLDADAYYHHNITVEVRDNGNPNKANFTYVIITLNDVNDNSPQFSNLPHTSSDREVLDSIKTVGDILTVVATDGDLSSPNNQIASYKLENNYYTDGQAVFSIGETSGIVSINGTIDADTHRELYLNISVTDGGSPSLTTYGILTIIPDDRNDNVPEVDQLIPAIFPIINRSPVSIGPSIRVIDKDGSFVLREVSVELQDPVDIQDNYEPCLSTCQDERVEESGFLEGSNPAFDLISLATFHNEGVSDITFGQGNCATKRFVRLDEANSANNGYGTISQNQFGSVNFATGEFSFSFLLNLTNEGHVVGIVDNSDPNANHDDVDRVFAIRIRRYILDVVYSYNGIKDQKAEFKLGDILNSPITQFFAPEEYNQTRHYTVVVKNDQSNPVAELYINCNLLATRNMDGLPDSTISSNNVTIARLIPGPFSTDNIGRGHMGGDLHGLYYYPFALTSNQIQDICACENIKPPSSYPSSITISEQSTTTITIMPSNSTIFPAAGDVNIFLRGITYDYKLTDAPESNKELVFTTHDGNENVDGESTGQITFVDSDDELPFIDLNGLISGSNYSVEFVEDSSPVQLADMSVRVGRELDTSIITIDKLIVELVNPLDGNSERLIGEETEYITMTTKNNNQTLEFNGPGLSSEFAGILQAIKYENTNQNPTSSEFRDISFTVHDTNGRVNNPPSYTFITIQPVNDAPTLSLEKGATSLKTLRTVAFMENGDPVNLLNVTDIEDVDNSNIQRAVVNISNNFVSGKDSLSIEAMNNIISNYDSSTGILTLTGSATVEDYESVLLTLVFDSTDNPLLDSENVEPSLLRTVDISVNDGMYDSNIVSVEIEFITENDATNLDINGSNVLTYVEGSQPLLIAPYAHISDSDNEYLLFMRISFVAGSSTSDVFVYNGDQPPQLFFEQSTLEEFESILRNVSYLNIANEPSLDNRTIRITLEDFNGNNAIKDITVVVKDANEHPPEFGGLPYSFDLKENAPVNTTVGVISASDIDVSPADIQFTLSSSDFKIQKQSATSALILTNKVFDFEVDNMNMVFTVTASDGELQSTETVSVTLEDINEPPILTYTDTSFVAAAQQSRQLITSNITIEDPDEADEIESATLILAEVPAMSVEYLSLNESAIDYTFTSISIESHIEYELKKLPNATIGFEEALKYVQYTAEEIEDPSTVRSVTIFVTDVDGLESNEVKVEVTLADIPQFSKDTYEVSLIEGMSHPDFVQVQATVANPNHTLVYSIEEYPNIIIDNTTGYISLTVVLDYEETPKIELDVFAVDYLPLPRTATATLIINAVDVDDVKPIVTIDGSIDIELGKENQLFQTIGVEDPDTFPIESTSVTIRGNPIEPSVFSGRMCVDEKIAITKMTSVCGLSNEFIKLLSEEEIGPDATITTDTGNTILTTTGSSNSYLQSNANLTDFEDILDELTLAFWINPDSQGTGYVIFLSSEDASERYFTVYYKSPRKFIVSFKQQGIKGLIGQVRVIFQLPKSIEDDHYHFIMLYYSNLNVQLSVDGTEVISSAVSYASIYDKLFEQPLADNVEGPEEDSSYVLTLGARYTSTGEHDMGFSGKMAAVVILPGAPPDGFASCVYGCLESMTVDTTGTSIASLGFDVSTRTLSLVGDAPDNEYEKVLQQLTYTNKASDSTIANANSLRLTIIDSAGGQTRLTLPINFVTQSRRRRQTNLLTKRRFLHTTN